MIEQLLISKTATNLEKTAYRAGLVFLGACLLTISSKLSVPFWPVPMTMQTLVVMLIGGLYAPKLAVATVAAYLGAGALGLPVFAGTPEKGIGLLYMVGTTGGYLAGFLLSALTISTVLQKFSAKSFLPADLIIQASDLCLVLGLGCLYLSTFIGLEQAFLLGVQPFITGSILKAVLATGIILLVKKSLAKT